MAARFAGIVLAGALAACARLGTHGLERGGAPKDELRVTIAQEPATLNPLLELNDYETFVSRFAFEPLVTSDAGGTRLLPRLAVAVPTVENGGISPDGRTITWHLRPNVRWQDGVPFTSADVKFSFAAIADPTHNVANRRGFELIRAVETPNARTVIVHLRRPFAPAITWFFGDGNGYAILPAHAFARESDFNRSAFNALPIGSGPFRVVRWLRGQEIDLAANDGYYLGKPHLRRIVVRFVPDEATAIDQLRTHESDLFSLASVGAYRQLRTIGGIAVSLTSTHAASVLLMNVTRGALRDVRVRRAIVAAIDKRAIVRKLTAGAAAPATEDLAAFMWAYDRRTRVQTYDPVAARALLRAAGYTIGPEGILVKAGAPLALELAFAQTNVTARAAVVQVQAYLRAVGIDVSVKGYNGSQMFAGYGAGGVYQTGNFDLAWYTMTLGIDPDSSGRFTCAAIPPAGQNYSRYCNPEMDAAEAAGLGSPKTAVRAAAYARVQALLARDAPIDFVYWPKNVDAYSAGLRGFAPNPIIASWNAERWSF